MYKIFFIRLTCYVKAETKAMLMKIGNNPDSACKPCFLILLQTENLVFKAPSKTFKIAAYTPFAMSKFFLFIKCHT